VAVCTSGPVTCVTTTVSAAVLQGRHIFGLQQAVFPDVPLHLDLVLVVRVYVDDGRSERAAAAGRENGDDQRSIASDGGSLNSQRSALTSSRNSMETKAGVPEDSLTLVAWAFLPLAVSGKARF